MYSDIYVGVYQVPGRTQGWKGTPAGSGSQITLGAFEGQARRSASW